MRNTAAVARAPAQARTAPARKADLPRTPLWLVLSAAALILVVGVGAYLNSFKGQFFLDDHILISDNPLIWMHPTTEVQYTANGAKTNTTWGDFVEKIATSQRPVVYLSLWANCMIDETFPSPSVGPTPGPGSWRQGLVDLLASVGVPMDVKPGLRPWLYHLANLFFHLVAGLALFGILRRTFRQERLRAYLGDVSLPMALIITLIWLVHPVNTSAVTYVIQRCESLMGMFFLLTMYLFIRFLGAKSQWKWAWFAGAMLACAFGMGSKEVMFTAALVILGYDLIFVSCLPTRARLGFLVGLPAVAGWVTVVLAILLTHLCEMNFGLISQMNVAFQAFIVLALPLTLGALLVVRQRTGRALAMFGNWLPHFALTVVGWSVLALLVGVTPSADSAGFGMKAFGPMDYAVSQFGVITHYFQLMFWPAGQCMDYAWPLVRQPVEWLPYVPGILALGALTILALVRWPVWGYVGLWFFIILGPTSSFMPIADLCFEHRVYLPMIGVICLVVVGLYVLARYLLALIIDESQSLRPLLDGTAAVAAAGIIAALAYATYARNCDYYTLVGMYSDIVAKRKDNARAHSNLGVALAQRQFKSEEEAKAAMIEAGGHFKRALELKEDYPEAHNNYGVALERLGNSTDAELHYRRAIQLLPKYADAQNNLGLLLSKANKIEEGSRHLRAAVDIKPHYVDAWYNLGVSLSILGDTQKDPARTEEAMKCFRHALQLQPNYARAYFNMGQVLAKQGRTEEAIQCFRNVLALAPEFTEAYYNLALAHVGRGQYKQARAVLERSLSLRQNDILVGNTLARLLCTCPDDQVRDGGRAVLMAESICKATGYRNASALDTLAAAYAQTGQWDKAIEAMQRALAIAQTANDANLIAQLRTHLELYEKHQPLREGPPASE